VGQLRVKLLLLSYTVVYRQRKDGYRKYFGNFSKQWNDFEIDPEISFRLCTVLTEKFKQYSENFLPYLAQVRIPHELS
jgi:hypothetical protein